MTFSVSSRLLVFSLVNSPVSYSQPANGGGTARVLISVSRPTTLFTRETGVLSRDVAVVGVRLTTGENHSVSALLLAGALARTEGGAVVGG